MGLEMTYTTVMEDVGTVEVCVVVFTPNSMFPCPIAFPFAVSLTTEDVTAGEIKIMCCKTSGEFLMESIQSLQWIMKLSLKL